MPSICSKLLAPLALAFLAPGALAGTLTVAPNPGPGIDFTSIQAAVDAAVEGDTILVETGTYFGQVVIDGKALTLQGLGPVSIGNVPASGQARGQLLIQNIGAGQAVDVRSITTFRDGFVPGPGIELADSAGRIWLEESGTLNFGGRGIVISNCANVLLAEVDSRAARAVDLGGVATPREGLFVDGLGHVGVVDSAFFGSGLAPFTLATVPATGGAAVRVERGDVALHGVDLVGGNGTSALVAGCEVGAPGGPGLSINGAPGLPVLVRGRAVTASAGLGGAFDPGCTSAPAAAVAIDDPGGRYVPEPGTLRLLALPSFAASGQPFNLSYQGEGLDLVAVFVGPPVIGQQVMAFMGDLWLNTSSAKLMAVGQAAVDGSWAKSFSVPVAGVQARAQGFVVSASGAWWLTTPASILIH